jgi:hypothetical protein
MATDSNRLVTNAGKLEVIFNDLINYVNNPGATSGLYIFTANPNPWPGSDIDIGVPDNTPATVVNTYNNMIFGKQVGYDQVFVMIPRYDWESGTVFTMYTDTDANLYSENFYTVVNSSSEYYVFKCLNNNNDSPSTEAPNFSDTSPDDTYYQTSDGYLWKYMYTIDRTTFNSIATSNFIPVIPDANVVANSVAGAIDVIAVNQSGSFYNNYYAGQFDASTIEIGSNPLVYGLGFDASSVNGYYIGCILTITDGTGKGQYSLVDNYQVLGTAKEVILNQPFLTVPDATSQYQISPSITVVGDGKQSSNVVARALINAASSNSIYSVEILDRGEGYRFATATVNTSPSAPVTNNAILQVIIPPHGGHGANPYSELGGTRVGITVTYANSESNTITTQGSYRTIGLLKEPLFANIQINTFNSTGNSGSNGQFLVPETIYQYTASLLSNLGGTISCNASSNVVVGTNTSFLSSFSNGGAIFITDEQSNNFLGVINYVANNTYLVLDSNCTFTSANVHVGIANISATGTATFFQTSVLNVTNVGGTFGTGSNIIGGTTGATASIANTLINGIEKTTTTFQQLTTYIGTIQGVAAFIPGETVYQLQSGATAVLQSVAYGNTAIYLDNEVGIFNVNQSIVGNTSGATFNVTSKYPGDLVPDSGEILYLEDFGPISRSNTQSETIKIILEL